jgi:4a-hydroxytetrahydrobiopterin dehydratase
MARVLSAQELEERLERLPEWALIDGALERAFQFRNFVEAMAFVNTVAGLAEEANHHPDIDVRWNKVRLALVTHSAGGITAADAEMAERIDRIE